MYCHRASWTNTATATAAATTTTTTTTTTNNNNNNRLQLPQHSEWNGDRQNLASNVA